MLFEVTGVMSLHGHEITSYSQQQFSIRNEAQQDNKRFTGQDKRSNEVQVS